MSPTHDYILSNQSGASFRTDLNNALAAIASNNSNSSSPATTYAYQWWADTSAGTLKIRNSANNAWIELLQLDGTLTLEDGSASSPALAFRDDLNTGIFSSAADTFDIATGGVGRFQIDSSEITFNETGADTDFRIEGSSSSSLFFCNAGDNRIGLRTTSPSKTLDVSGTFCISNSATSRWDFDRDDSTGALTISDTGSEVMRIGATGTKPVLIGSTVITSDKLTVLDQGNAFMSIRSDGEADNQVQVLDFATGTAERTSSNMTASIGATIHSQSGGTLKADLSFSTNGGDSVTQKMIIKDTGKVGINDTTPDADLSVSNVDSSLNAAFVDIGKAGGNRFKLGYEGNNCFLGGSSNTAMFIFKQNVNTDGNPQASGSEVMRMDNNGNLLVGRTSAGNTGNGHSIRGGDAAIFSRDSTGETVQIARNSNDGSLVEFRSGDTGNAGILATIAKSGSSIVYNTSSDYRLKENVTAISDGITRLKTLKPYRFNFKSHPDKTVDGFFAHEVTAVPEAITGAKDQVDSDNNPVYQQIDQSKIVPLLTAALQEAISKIEVLETKVAALEAA